MQTVHQATTQNCSPLGNTGILGCFPNRTVSHYHTLAALCLIVSIFSASTYYTIYCPYSLRRVYPVFADVVVVV